MLVKIQNLKKGDEIMLAAGTKLVFAKVLREPVLRFKKYATGARVPVLYRWGSNQGKQLHSNVKCEVKTKTTIEHWYGRDRKVVTYDNTLENYNDEKYFDLNFRDIWLIEK